MILSVKDRGVKKTSIMAWGTGHFLSACPENGDEKNSESSQIFETVQKYDIISP